MTDKEEYRREDIDRIISSCGSGKEKVVSLLHAIQEKYNYLPADALEYLSGVTGISPMTIEGVSTFYSQFRLNPAGRYFIKVCIGTACHVKGALDIYEDFKKHLDIPEDKDTDKEKLFTVSKVACLGCCMLAPAVQIDDITYGHVTSAAIPGIIYDFLASVKHPGKVSDTDEDIAATEGTVRMCTCSSCSAAGADSVFLELRDTIKRERYPVKLKSTGCTGISFQAPLVEIELADEKVFRYGMVKKEHVPKILCNHFKSGDMLPLVRHAVYSVLERLYTDEADDPVIRYAADVRGAYPMDYTDYQQRIATSHAGRMDPLDIDEYIESGGFSSLEKIRALDDRNAVIRTIRESKLRGRGGAGFETALKWAEVADSKSDSKYIICNADEGDPGAFMDRMLLESFPFRVIEGMAIAAHACGVRKGVIYVRSEYPLAVYRIKQALEISTRRGFTGGDSLLIDVAVSAGAYVCGEETALIAALEGNRGIPHFRPPYPSVKGLRGNPTLVNNVETFALVPWIISNGGGAFARIGTEKSCGTKTFALAGKINNGGLIEVEMGSSLENIVYRIGGGVKNGKTLKAVQVGGPSGGCLPEAMVSTPVDYEVLKGLGAIMGSGGMIVLDEEDCIVDMARYFMSFTQNESCGKCTFGRVGTKRMLEMLDEIIAGRGNEKMLVKLKSLALEVKRNSLCGLGKAAPNPVLSAMDYFKDEFLAHLEGRCPAKKCKSLIRYSITDKCIGCTKCAQRCPSDAIIHKPYRRHEIDQDLCVKCDTCRQNCPSEAIVRE